MNRIIHSILVLTTLATGGGCSVAYSSVRQQSDGTYLLTESRSRFFKVQGTMYRCTAAGESLQCQVIALPKPR
jgi:hypothetical protein